MSQGSNGKGSGVTQGGSRAPRTSFKFGVASTFPGPLNPLPPPPHTRHCGSGSDSIPGSPQDERFAAKGEECGREGGNGSAEGPWAHRSPSREGGTPLFPPSQTVKEEAPTMTTMPEPPPLSVITISSGTCTPIPQPHQLQHHNAPPSATAVPLSPSASQLEAPQREQAGTAQRNDSAVPSSQHKLPVAVAPSPSTPPLTHSYTIPDHLKDSAEMASILAVLDDSQRAAVCFDPSTPLLIQAGAGSGKTQTMASRIAFLLLCGVPPRRILGICFTRQAAETLRQRVRAVLPPSLQAGVKLLTLKTLHSFGLQCLRRYGVMSVDTEVYDAAKQRALARRVVQQHAVHDKSADAVEALVEYVNKAKTKRELPVAQFSPNVQDGYLFRFYEASLHEEDRAVDFGDLQRLFFEILRPVRDKEEKGQQQQQQRADGNGKECKGGGGVGGEEGGGTLPLHPSRVCEALREDYTHIVVDEFQDFNEIQFEILALLAGDTCRVTCVGDPNQCIYEWRGAMPNVFPAWKGRFPQTEIRVLQVNYRSDGEIVSALNGLVHSCQQPHHHRADRKITLIRCHTDEDVSDAVPFVIERIFKQRERGGNYSDMAVLCRTRRRVQVMCDALRRKNIPVRQLKGVAPDGISIVRALLAYLKLAVRPDLDSEVRVALTSGPRYVPPKPSKALFFGLAAMAAERWERVAMSHYNEEEGGGLVPSPSSSLLATPSAVPISPFSFYALLSEAAFHDFSPEAYPKLKGPSKAQHKTIKHFLSVVRDAHERLYRPPNCDVADLIRHIAREGGFETEDAAMVDGNAAAVAAATGRKRKRAAAGSPATGGRRGGRASASLVDSVAADFNTAAAHAPAAGEETSEAELARREEHLARQLAKLPRGAEADDDDTALPYTTEEEAAMLATSRVSVTELLLCAYEDVMEEIKAEEGSDGNCSLLEKERNGGVIVTAGVGAAAAAPQPPTPATILRRVLDQFVTLLPSDDFGSLKSIQANPPTPSGTTARDKSDLDGGEEEQRQQQLLYPQGHLPSTTVNKVTVSTVHRAKGMEWPSVIIPDCWVGEFPTSQQAREERRVFYVAMSRAMTDLVLVTARTSEDPKYTKHGSKAGKDGAVSSDHVSTTKALAETPFLAPMKGKEMAEEEYAALRLATMQAHGAL